MSVFDGKYIGIINGWQSEAINARNKIANEIIDLELHYVMGVDETEDNWDPYSVTQVLYSCDAKRKPICLENDYRAVSQDNEGIIDVMQRAKENYNLNRRNCSILNYDAVSYNVAAAETLQYVFPLSVPCFDCIHLTNNSVDKGTFIYIV